MIFLRLALVLSFLATSGQLQAQETGSETKASVDIQQASPATPEVPETPEAPDVAEQVSSGRVVEKIQVTGSHIKRIDVEGPSPVLTLDRDYIEKSGYNNIGDVLRDTTVASFGGARETSLSGGANTGATTTSLRGFGADRILILLDGKRLPTLGGTSQVDLALIPMAAVERVEILKDGASAIYGSDALGGVINIITKKNYDGASVDLGYTYTEGPGADRTNVKLTYGKSYSRGDFLGVLQYRGNQATDSRDYEFARATPDFFSVSSSPGSYVDQTNTVTAGSTADPCPAGRVASNGFCTFDYSQYSQITPQIDQYSALLAGSYELNEELKLYARGLYTHRNVQSKLAPPPDAFRDDSETGGLNTTIPNATATDADKWNLSGVTGDLSLVRYRLVEEAGPRLSEVISDSYALQTGVTGYLFDSWEWEFSATHGVSDTTNEGVSGYANKQILFNLANQSPTGFNAFAAPGSKSDISSATYKPLDRIQSSMSTVNLLATGEIFDMSAGPLALAVGASNAWQTFEQTADAVTNSGAQWGGGVSATGKGVRDFQSGYAEFSIPPFTGMEVQVAGRFDNYNDFGSTFNPKFGFRYQPWNILSFRGTWGTGFRAPSLDDLYQNQTVAYPFGLDPVTDFEGQFERVTGGNEDLKEETTESFNIGTVIQPTRSLSFVVDYWQTEQENLVTAATMRDIFRAEETLGVGFLNGLGIDIDRDPGTQQVQRVIAPKVNAASLAVKGLDFQTNFIAPVFGNFKFRTVVAVSYLIEYLSEPFPGLGKENQVGFAGIPYWKNNVTIGLGNPTYDVSFLVRTIGESDKSSNSPGVNGKTRDHTEFDLRMQYNTSWQGQFSLVVKNVLNTERPNVQEYLSNGFLITNIYDPFGRAMVLNYRQDF